MRFFVGLHHPSLAPRFERCMVSVNALKERKADFHPREWLLDSGAFTEISTHGRYRSEPEDYAERVERWSRCGTMLAAVSQDYMCEEFVLERTGLAVGDHQESTIERYRRIRRLASPEIHVMPVLQGQAPADYARNARAYGPLLAEGSWVGVGSVCKRNGRPAEVEAVPAAILAERPDLKLHGFGIKLTALASDRGAPWVLLVGLHGLELQRPQAGAQRPRLAGGRALLRAGGAPACAALAGPPFPEPLVRAPRRGAGKAPEAGVGGRGAGAYHSENLGGRRRGTTRCWT